jgi:hypothetical protein
VEIDPKKRMRQQLGSQAILGMVFDERKNGKQDKIAEQFHPVRMTRRVQGERRRREVIVRSA